jgi:hypothetical protein
MSSVKFDQADQDGHRPGDTFAGFLTGDRDHDRRNVDILLDTIAEVNRTRDLDTLLVSVVDRTLAFTMAERGILMLHDHVGNLHIRVARDDNGQDLDHDLDFSRSVPRKVLEDGKAVCMTATASENRIDLTQSIQQLGLRTVMGAPLSVQGRVIGVLYVDSSARSRTFTHGDFSLFKALSYQLAVAIENARMAKKEQGLALARDLQRNLLPAEALTLPGFDIHGINRTCDETGGDYFDYLRHRDGQLGLAVGDVSGHGFAAALLMATGRALLRAYASTEADPARVVTLLNHELGRDMGTDKFMTLFYGVLDLESRTMRYAKAGHCDPILLRAATGEFESLGGRGMGLGFEPHYVYSSFGPVTLERDDVLLLYTDGIPEARNPSGEFFGLERVHQIMAEHHENARELATHVVEAVTEFTGGPGYADDLTLIVVRATD